MHALTTEAWLVVLVFLALATGIAGLFLVLAGDLTTPSNEGPNAGRPRNAWRASEGEHLAAPTVTTAHSKDSHIASEAPPA